MTAENSERIITWLEHEPSDAYTKQEFVRGFEKDKVRLPSNETKVFCLNCFLISRFPLVLKCGHVSSHRCFPEWFKSSREPKCNYCRAQVVHEDVMTLHDYRIKRPGSITAKMYDVAMITCSNIGCTKEFKINQINNHEFYDCQFRIIKCPANKCLYKNNPNGVHKHALECPFQTFYCSTCYGEYAAEVLTHSCTKRLQRQLAESVNSPLGWLPTIPNHRNGDVILPSHVTHLPFYMDVLIDAQLSLGLRPAMMSSGQGLTGLAPRRRLLQRQLASRRGLNKVDLCFNVSENNISQFYFS